MKAHKLALNDLGRAVALNDSRAENYYLRGDCHAKLGNYELALSDYNQAESKGFTDVVSLTYARGMIYRLLGDSYRARIDFETALAVLEAIISEERRQGGHFSHPQTEQQGTTGAKRTDAALIQIRLASLRALCFLDSNMYNAGYTSLVSTCSLVDEMEVALVNGRTISDAILDIDNRILAEEEALEKEKKKEEKEKEKEKKKEGEEEKKEYGEEKEEKEPEATPTKADSAQIVQALLDEMPCTPAGSIVDAASLAHVRRLKWVLLYHMGLALHQQKRYNDAQRVLRECTEIHMSPCAPDDMCLGIVSASVLSCPVLSCPVM